METSEGGQPPLRQERREIFSTLEYVQTLPRPTEASLLGFF